MEQSWVPVEVDQYSTMLLTKLWIIWKRKFRFDQLIETSSQSLDTSKQIYGRLWEVKGIKDC